MFDCGIVLSPFIFVFNRNNHCGDYGIRRIKMKKDDLRFVRQIWCLLAERILRDEKNNGIL